MIKGSFIRRVVPIRLQRLFSHNRAKAPHEKIDNTKISFLISLKRIKPKSEEHEKCIQQLVGDIIKANVNNN